MKDSHNFFSSISTLIIPFINNNQSPKMSGTDYKPLTTDANPD